MHSRRACLWFAANPTEHTLAHLLQAALPSRSITFATLNSRASPQLVAYCDANLGGTRPQRSPYAQTGYIIRQGGLVVSWSSKRQQHVAYSTEMAEFNAAYSTCQMLLLVATFFSELRLLVQPLERSLRWTVLCLLFGAIVPTSTESRCRRVGGSQGGRWLMDSASFDAAIVPLKGTHA